MSNPPTNDPMYEARVEHYNEPPLRRPISVLPLNYYRQDPRESRKVVVGVGLQFLSGFLLLNVAVVLSTVIEVGQGMSTNAVFIGTGITFLAFALFMRVYAKWTGFIPGALAGLFLAPVSFFFACASQLRL